MKIYYVLGLVFSKDLKKILLIKKEHPNWQKGKLNGIGGHVEKFENEKCAIIRELEEEADIASNDNDWKEFAVLEGSEFSVTCYLSNTIYFEDFISKTDEIVSIYNVNDIISGVYESIENLKWLILLAVDKLEDGRPEKAIIRYE